MANRCGNNGNSDRLFSWAPKSWQMVAAAMKLKDGCSLEEKRWPTCILKNRDITLLTKVHLVKAMVFPVVMYGCESRTLCNWRIDTFELWCWRRLLRVPWTERSNQSILEEIRPEYSLEGLMLKLKFQYFGHLMWRMTHWKRPCAGKDWRREEKVTTEDEMVGWHHRLNGQEYGQVLGVDDGQESWACCSQWDCKELDRTEQLNWTGLHWVREEVEFCEQLQEPEL